ncbi:hypothetical protein GCM10025771_22720 [Niveibacterium umoris]|uniref:Uncharacterized protein (DUF2235 family) n=1 Tax=Niveibacterium umoris TaxID=1193620 RepID=A0A840BLY3_9RHOO|nr:DUF2235 domain-containing protein [Niveibacterium umoris]MBB4012539.1 uncharacterized protein (DUF2235 family) [Niveibacterium umoris]
MTETEPRTLVVCLDGTWNDVGSRTNVVRFFEQLMRDSQQLTYYDEGVGIPERGNLRQRLMQRLSGGLFGTGLLVNVMQAYRWLTTHYRDGDRLVIIGFSRGAYSARVLASMLGTPGLLQGGDAGSFDAALQAVQLARETRTPVILPGLWRCRTVPVDFLGVWDTVGALGVPSLNMRWRPAGLQPLRFGNTQLPDHVKVARQALAIDEHRADYAPVLWTSARAGADVLQMWFPGCHAQVGGGYPDDVLCEISLLWMAAQAAPFVRFRQHSDELEGGHFAPRRLRLDGSEYLAPTIDAWREFLGGLYRVFSPRHLRRICVEGLNEAVHPSAWDKWSNDPDYRPLNLAHAGREHLHAASDEDRSEAGSEVRS